MTLVSSVGKPLPSISVVVPTKNRPDEIARMLRSLRAQPTMAREVIVVDQSTPEYVLEPFPQLVHIHDTTITGASAARNRGLDSARGDIILFFDDDVILEADCVREVALAFAARPDVIGAQCSIRNVQDTPPTLLYALSSRIFEHGFFNPRPRRSLGNSTPRLIDALASAYRRELFAVERFDEALAGYSLAEDWDLTKRAARHGALTFVLAAHVRHEHSSSNRLPGAAYARLRRNNILYLYDKLHAERDPRNRFWKQWWLLGEKMRAMKRVLLARPAP